MYRIESRETKSVTFHSVRVWRPCWFQPIRADPTSICTDCQYFCFSAKRVNIDSVGCRERRHGPALPSSLRRSFSAMGCREFPILTQQYRGEREREQLWHQIKQLIEQAHLRHTHNRFLFFLLHDSPPENKKFKLFNRMALLWTTNKRGKPHSLLAFPPYIEITTRLRRRKEEKDSPRLYDLVLDFVRWRPAIDRPWSRRAAEALTGSIGYLIWSSAPKQQQQQSSSSTSESIRERKHDIISIRYRTRRSWVFGVCVRERKRV